MLPQNWLECSLTFLSTVHTWETPFPFLITLWCPPALPSGWAAQRRGELPCLMWHQMEQETSLMDMWFISGWNINTHLKPKENNKKNKENQKQHKSDNNQHGSTNSTDQSGIDSFPTEPCSGVLSRSLTHLSLDRRSALSFRTCSLIKKRIPAHLQCLSKHFTIHAFGKTVCKHCFAINPA